MKKKKPVKYESFGKYLTERKKAWDTAKSKEELTLPHYFRVKQAGRIYY